MTRGPQGEVRGDLLVVGLVISLLAFLYLFATVTTIHLDPSDRAVLIPGVARLTHSALMGVGLFIALAAYRDGRSGWWLYAGAAVAPVLQLVAIAGWLAKWRTRPGHLGRWVI